MRLLYAGNTSVPGVTYSGVWGAVLAKAKFGNRTVVTQVGGTPRPQADYAQVDWSKWAATLRGHLSYIAETAELYVANPTGHVEGLLAALSRIEDRACEARTLCYRIVGSYQKGV